MANEARVVSYGSFSAQPHGEVSFAYDENANVTIVVEAEISNNAAAAFQSGLAGMISELNTHNKAFSLSLEGATILSYDPASRTGLRTRCRVETTKVLNRAVLIRFVVKASLPAEAVRGDAAAGGFVDGNIGLSIDFAGRATYRFRGEWRSEASEEGRTLLDSATVGVQKRINDWLDAYAVMPVSGMEASSGSKSTYYQTNVSVSESDWNGTDSYPGAVFTFEATSTYQLIRTDSAGTALNTDIIVESLVITPVEETRWSPEGQDAPWIFSVDATIAIKNQEVQASGLAEYYRDNIEPFLFNHINTASGYLSQIGGTNDDLWTIEAQQIRLVTVTNAIAVSLVLRRQTAIGWHHLEATVSFENDRRRIFMAVGSGVDDAMDVVETGRRTRGIERYSGVYATPTKVSPSFFIDLFPPAGDGWVVEKDVIPRLKWRRARTSAEGIIWLAAVELERPYTYVADNSVSRIVNNQGELPGLDASALGAAT